MTQINEMVIRPLQSQDYEKWLPLWQGYQAFYKVNILPDITRTTWERILNTSEPVFGAVAEVNHEIVGIVHWIFHRSCWTIGDYCYLQDLFVAEPVRGKGIGRALIEHVYEDASLAGCSRVHWLTHETNKDAMHLYNRIADRSGFIQYRKIFPVALS